MEPAKDTSLVIHSQYVEDDVTPMKVEIFSDKIIYADEIPVEEEFIEIQESSDDSDVLLNIKQEPIDSLISPIPSQKYEHLKSPLHSLSDYGYESHGSPSSMQDFKIAENHDDLNFLLNDLFPTLA